MTDQAIHELQPLLGIKAVISTSQPPPRPGATCSSNVEPATFSANRAQIWPNVTTRKLEVHERGETCVDVTEGGTSIAR